LGGLYSGGLIFGGGAYIWNEVSVSTCGGLIHGGGACIRGPIVGGLWYVCIEVRTLLIIFTMVVHINVLDTN
jgi:hypothetical protein